MGMAVTCNPEGLAKDATYVPLITRVSIYDAREYRPNVYCSGFRFL